MDRILRLEFLYTGHQQVSTRNGRLSFVYTEKISTLKAGSWFVPNILPRIALRGCTTWKGMFKQYIPCIGLDLASKAALKHETFFFFADGISFECCGLFLGRYGSKLSSYGINSPLIISRTSSLREELNSESLSETIEGELEREDMCLFLCFPSSHFFCYITCCDYDVREKPAVVISRALQVC